MRSNSGVGHNLRRFGIFRYYYFFYDDKMTLRTNQRLNVTLQWFWSKEVTWLQGKGL